MRKISVLFAFLAMMVGLGRAQAQCTDGSYDCFIAIEGNDSFGDGWNGGEIAFVQNGVSLGTFTLTNGSSGSDTIRICAANGPVTCNWTAGMYSSEVSFTFTDSLGSLLYNCASGGSLSNGFFVTLAPCPSCPGVSALTVGDISTDGATVSWTELGDADGWYYCYGTASTPSGSWSNASDTSVTLTGLQSNTLYYFFVYSDCGSGDTSLYSSISFRTACGGITLPYSEDFESFESSESLPFCWMRREVASYTDYYGSVVNYPKMDEYNGHSGYNSLFFNPYYGNQSIVSPLIPAPANTLEVQMWIKGGEAVYVGYATSNDPSAVFHPVALVGPSDDTLINDWGYQYTEYKWTRVTVPFDTVSATGQVYVILRATSSIESETMYIDDLVIRQINSCPQPENLAVTATTSDEVTFGWNCPAGSQWEVVYGPAGFNPDTASSYVGSTTPSVTISDLEGHTMYDFYVRTVCGGQYSYWSEKLSTMPGLYVMSASIDTLTGCGSTLVDDGGINGEFSLSLNQVLVLMPDDEDMTIRIQGFAHLYNTWGESYSEDRNILRIYSGSDTTGMLLASYNTVDIDSIDLTSEVGPMTLWFRTGSYSGDENDGFQFGVSCVDRPSCTTPYDLVVNNISGTYALASWRYNTVLGEAPGFVLTATDDAGNVVGPFIVSGTERSCVLQGLDQRTAYHLELTVDCPGATPVSADFTTVCNNGGDLQIGTGTSTNSYIPAYLFASSSVSQQIFTASELNGATSIEGFSVYMTNSAATPARQWDVFLDTTTLSSYSGASDYVAPTLANRYFSGMVNIAQGWVTVTFDSAFTVPAGKNVVLTVNDKTGTNGSSRYFRTTTTTDAMTVYGYTTSGVMDATSATAVLAGTTNTLTRRNTIKLLTGCSVGGCLAPVITSAVPDGNTVTLNWTSVGTETAWKVEYRTGTNAWTVATASTTSTTYTVTGLSYTTTYAFRVSSLCGTEEASRTIIATTPCGPESLPFSENFNVFLASSYNADMKQCWYRGYTNPSPYNFYPYRSDYYGHSGNYSMAMVSNRSYFVLPLMDGVIDSLNVSFYAFNSTPDLPGEIEVGVCTDPTDTNTFTVVSTFVVADTIWMQMEADMEYYNGPEGHIFFRLKQNDYVDIYIDDIVVDYMPDCRRVTSVTVSDITASSASLTIVDSHNYGNYVVYYGTVNDTSMADTMHVSGTTAILSGLDENTQYFVWVVAQCTTGSYGRAFAVAPFRTMCSPIIVTDNTPYVEEFEGGVIECMLQEGNDGLRWTVSSGIGSTHSHSGSYMISMASNYSYSSMLILPIFNFTGMSQDAEFSFYRNQYGVTDNWNSPVAAGLLEVYYRTAPTASWTLLATVDSSVNSWDRFTYTLPASQGAAFFQVALKGYAMGNSYGIFVDDLKVSAPPTCPMPTDVTVRNIDERSATVAWTGTAPAYKVQYRLQGSLSWSTTTVENVDTLNISPLDMASLYEVRVTSICSVSDRSEASNIVTFTTDFCSNRVEANNYNSGDGVTASTNALVNTAAGYSYAEVLIDAASLSGMTEISGLSFYLDNVGSASFMTNCQLYMGHTSASTMTGFHYDTTFVKVYDGDISATAAGARRVRFTTPFAWNGSSNVVLGVMYATPDYNLHSATQFAAHQALANKVYYGSSSYASFTPGSADSVISAANRGASSMVPDLTLYSCQPTCFEPVVSSITATATSVTVNWYDENAIVEIQIKEASAATWDNSEVINAGHNNIHTYTYDFLTDRTDYNIRLRRDCTIETIGFSDWVEFDVRTDTMCSIPENISLTVTGANTATVTWTDGSMTGSRWEIHLWNNVEDHYYDVADNPATIDGLTAGSSYQVAVRAYCGQGDHVVGDFSNSVNFDNVCYPVTDLAAQTLGSDGVLLTWTPGNRNQQWLVSYGYQGFSPNEQLGYRIVNEPTVTINGLNGGGAKGVGDDTYTFRVRAICGDGWNSDWAEDITASFTGIGEIGDAEARFALWPNPATNRVRLRLNDYSGKADIVILSVDGRTVNSLVATDSELSVDISDLAAGTYFVRVQTDAWVSVRKLVVR